MGYGESADFPPGLATSYVGPTRIGIGSAGSIAAGTGGL